MKSNKLNCDSCGINLPLLNEDNFCKHCRNYRLSGIFDIKSELELNDLQDVLNPTGKTPARIEEE